MCRPLESTSKKVDGFYLLLFLVKYSPKENSQVVVSKERWPGDLLTEAIFSLKKNIKIRFILFCRSGKIFFKILKTTYRHIDISR